MSKSIRPCPLCNDHPTKQSFPFAINFEGENYQYYRCASCETVYVDPIPSEATFSLMYTYSNYHSIFYDDPSATAHPSSTLNQPAEILSTFAQGGDLVLDYGCGTGAFLNALQKQGFKTVGVEFNKEIANIASQNACCPVYEVDEFFCDLQPWKFDIIYLGDVLEHLPDPQGTLAKLLAYLKIEGLLMVEGPLENNHSPVYWASHVFGSVKRLLRPSFIGAGTPTHLFRTSAKAQKAFFERVCPSSQFVLWDVYETGWPYSRGTLIKRSISWFAKLIGGRGKKDIVFGNRFRTIISMNKK